MFPGYRCWNSYSRHMKGYPGLSSGLHPPRKLFVCWHQMRPVPSAALAVCRFLLCSGNLFLGDQHIGTDQVLQIVSGGCKTLLRHPAPPARPEAISAGELKAARFAFCLFVFQFQDAAFQPCQYLACFYVVTETHKDFTDCSTIFEAKRHFVPWG